MHFTYASPANNSSLTQGDVLRRTPAIDSLLQEVHPHFHGQARNKYFMVLTQSCDLVRRQAGAGCKAPYITIAVVRSLSSVVQRQIADLKRAEVPASLPVIGQKSKNKLSEFLTRLFNNNEPGLFFLESEDTDLDTDCVALLNLSIAIKSELHYDTCLKAKVLQLQDNFQSKLGWLVGQLYSRVGTDDWPPESVRPKVKKIVDDAAIWVDDTLLKALEQEITRTADQRAGESMTQDQVARTLATLPTRKQKVLERADAVISEVVGIEGEALLKKIRNRLKNDAALSSLLK